MDSAFHHLCDLFAHLGLAEEPARVREFIERHRPLAPEVRIEDASFWTPAQAAALRQALLEDSDWAEVVDQLSAALRA